MTKLNEIITDWRENGGTPGPWVFDTENVGKAFDWCWQLRTEIGGTPIYTECDSRRGKNNALAAFIAAAPDMADRIEALETLLTEIRDLRVEHHATMDEAEAVMPWTLWKGVLEDIKKVLGGRVMASRVKRSGVARHPFAVSRKPLLIFAYIAPSGALTGVIEASSIDAAWTIATGWGNAADIAELKAQGWRIYPCIAEWEPDQ